MRRALLVACCLLVACGDDGSPDSLLPRLDDCLRGEEGDTATCQLRYMGFTPQIEEGSDLEDAWFTWDLCRAENIGPTDPLVFYLPECEAEAEAFIAEFP